MTPKSNILRAGLLALATLATAYAGGEGWTSDFEAAKKQAAAEKKDLLLDFTGSDWCGWCIKLNKEVFQEDVFKTGVKDTLVLVELDFPSDKSKLSKETQAQNAKLGKEFNIRGYPTIMLCDATGKPFAKTGYKSGGPENYLTHLNELIAAREKRDAAFAAAKKATDNAEKAKFLVEGLEVLSNSIVEGYYADVVAEIVELDPADSTGYIKEREEVAAQKEAAAEKEATNQKKVQEFTKTTLGPLMRAKDYDKATATVATFIKENPDLDNETKINISLSSQLPRLVAEGDADAATKFIDELVVAYPNPKFAARADRIKTMVRADIEARAKKDASVRSTPSE
ncbi:thioredoxin family protein [Haloferula sp.]|uniref:thioredoxin family protein n=1 Tax=Haloferula sp. TaxID=2497595 RepID=UPI003C719392